MTGMRVISPGVLSLIQDGGRGGFQRCGVSVSGAMDPDSLLLGNRLGRQPARFRGCRGDIRRR